MVRGHFPVLLFIAVLLVHVQGERTITRYIPATDPSIRYVGRIFREPSLNRVSFDWPCVSIETSFYATSLNISLNGGNNDFIIHLDGRELSRLSTTDYTQVKKIVKNTKPWH